MRKFDLETVKDNETIGNRYSNRRGATIHTWRVSRVAGSGNFPIYGFTLWLDINGGRWKRSRRSRKLQ